MTHLPQNGQIIIFTVTPPGSYTRVGEAYRVECDKYDFRFVSVDRGSSTYDRPHMVARSQWRVA